MEKCTMGASTTFLLKASVVLLFLLVEVVPSMTTRVPVLCYCSHKGQNNQGQQHQEQHQPQQVARSDSCRVPVLCYCSKNGQNQQHHQYQQQYNQPQEQHNQPQQQHSQPQQQHNQPQQQHSQPQQNDHDNKQDHHEDNQTPSRCNYCIRPKCDPAGCTGAKNFDAAKDVKAFRDAVQGLGTTEDTLIDILTSRSDEQIEMIRQEYFRTGSSLLDDIKGDTSFKTKALLEALATPRPLFYAEQLHRAIDKGDTSAMIEIMTSLSPCAVREVASEYEKNVKKSLRNDIKKETVLDFENFMLELAKGNRNEDQTVDVQAAKKDAKALIDAGVGKWFGTDEKTFIDIFATRSYAHLREVIKQYNDMSSLGLKKDIEGETTDKLQEGLLTMVKNIENQPAYLAHELKESLDTVLPVPDDNNKLIRIMRARCGVDLGDIRDAYPSQDKGKSLADRIASKTYKDYEKALMSMLHK